MKKGMLKMKNACYAKGAEKYIDMTTFSAFTYEFMTQELRNWLDIVFK